MLGSNSSKSGRNNANGPQPSSNKYKGTKRKHGKSKSAKQAIIFIAIVVALDAVGYGIVLPVLPQLVIELTGETLSGAAYHIGWLWFAYAAVLFFFAPIMGGLSDKFGRRPVILLSMFTFAIDYLFMAVAPSMLLLFAGRAIAGMAGSSYSVANAYVADISNHENRAQNFGVLGASFGVGFILGPVIGGALGEISPRVPFYAAAVISFFNMIYGFFVLKESLPRTSRRAFDWRRANPVGALVHLKTNPVVFGLAMAIFLYMLGHFALPSVWSVYTLEKFKWSEYQIGISLGVAGVCMIIVQAGLMRIVTPRLGAPKVGVLGLLVMVVGFLAYAFAVTSWQLYVSLIFASLAGMVMPSLQGMMTSQVSPDSQGELQGAISSMNSIATVIAPLIMTGLFGYFVGPSTPFYFPGAAFVAASFLTFASLCIVLTVIPRIKKA